MKPRTRRPRIPRHFTPEQKAFARKVRDTNKNIVLRATAGAGKTTTSTFAAHLLDPELRAAYFVYNKHNVAGVNARLPDHIGALTLHAQGFRLCAEQLGRIEVDREANLDMIHRVNAHYNFGFPRSKARSLLKLWNVMRERIRFVRTEDDLRSLLRGISGLEDYLTGNIEKNVQLFSRFSVALVSQSEQDCRAGRNPDFTDLLYWPLLMRWTADLLDVVILDEAQDLTPLRQDFALSMLCTADGVPKGRLIAVGDPEQSIYQYAHASPELFYALTERPNTVMMPLSVSFRLPQNLIVQAQAVSDFITAAPEAAPGAVEHGYAWNMDYQHGDTVLCRLNAPLMQLALRLLESGISVDVRGLDIEARLMNYGAFLAQGFTAHTLPGLLVGGFQRAKRPFEPLVAEGDRYAKQMIDELRDLHRCLELLAQKVLVDRERAKLSDVQCYFRSLYREGADVLLSSVHKAKGLEWPRVTVLYPELMPLVYGDESEERCVAFVALTRAQDTLRFAYGEKAWLTGWRWGMPRSQAPDWVLPEFVGQPHPGGPTELALEAAAPPNLVLPPKDIFEELFGIAPVQVQAASRGPSDWEREQAERFAQLSDLSFDAARVLEPDLSVPELNPALSVTLHAGRARLAERQRELQAKKRRAKARSVYLSFDETVHTVPRTSLMGLLRSLACGPWRYASLWAYAALEDLERLPDEAKEVFISQGLYSTIRRFSVLCVRHGYSGLEESKLSDITEAFTIHADTLNFQFRDVRHSAERDGVTFFCTSEDGELITSAVHPVTLELDQFPGTFLKAATASQRYNRADSNADTERFGALPCPILPFVRASVSDGALARLTRGNYVAASNSNIVFPALN